MPPPPRPPLPSPPPAMVASAPNFGFGPNHHPCSQPLHSSFLFDFKQGHVERSSRSPTRVEDDVAEDPPSVSSSPPLSMNAPAPSGGRRGRPRKVPWLFRVTVGLIGVVYLGGGVIKGGGGVVHTHLPPTGTPPTPPLYGALFV